eukprot:c17898_g1_i2.p1 GENE.c17898_g1_i2~~c17898_g1_i2.p1  ORF type:complete len:202 (+),score=48.30 c17898_g1_i2:83-688(+)
MSLFSLSLFLLSLLSVSAIELTFWIDPQGNECFFEDIFKDDTVSGNFQVTAGGDMEVEFHILNPNGGVITHIDKAVEHDFEFLAETSGEYSFCFGNLKTYHDMKSITFELFSDRPVMNNVVDKNSMDDLHRKLEQLQHLVRDVQSSQRYLRNREKRHRSTTESTNTRVLWWSIIEAVAIVILSTFQVYYIKSFFNSKRTII